jgi:predicted O-methyltransferase YrrM
MSQIKRTVNYQNLAYTLDGDAGPSAKGTGPTRWSVSEPQALMLSQLAKGKRCLEIGTGTGFSTEALAKTATHVSTFDVDDEVRRLVWPGLPKNVIPYDRRHEGLSQAGREFDLIFVDGQHHQPAVKKDILEALPLMKREALWVFHDAQMHGVERAITEGLPKFTINQRQADAGPTTMWVCQVSA